MNPKHNHPQLTDADLDRALLADRDALVPSSGFASSVMNAVASSAPAPIPFPWKRALPGFAAAVLTLAVLVVAWVSALRSPAHAPLLLDVHARLAPLLAHSSGIWIAVSLAIPFLCLLLCRRLFAAH